MKKIFLQVKKSFVSVFAFDGDPQIMELLVIAALILMTGTMFYHFNEGWGLLDSLYFSVTTLTTVGYGDLVPTNDMSKLFTLIYILVGVGILLGFVNAVATHTRDKSPLDKLFKRK